MSKNRVSPQVTLPCCPDSTVKVTGRKSKQEERPRNHRCDKCGREYRINAAATPPKVM